MNDGFQPYCKPRKKNLKKNYIEHRYLELESHKKYCGDNKGKINEYFKNRKKSDSNYKLACNLRSRTSTAFKSKNVRKIYNNTIRSSTKMTPIQASKKVNEKLVYSNLQDKRRKFNPKFKLGQLVRTADIKRVFSKGDSTNYSYKLYTITEIIHDTIPSYKIHYLPERYNENLLLPKKLSVEQNNQVMKELNSIQKK